MSELTRVSETPRVTELEDGTKVYRTAQWSPPGCHGVGCGLRAFVKDGKLVKVEGDPDQPITNGRLCVRCLTLPEYLYHEDRLLYPMKRDRAFRGQPDKWERITWDEAYDIIVEKYHELHREVRPRHGLRVDRHRPRGQRIPVPDLQPGVPQPHRPSMPTAAGPASSRARPPWTGCSAAPTWNTTARSASRTATTTRATSCRNTCSSGAATRCGPTPTACSATARWT